MKLKTDTLGSPLELFTRNMFTEVIQKLSAYLAEGSFTLSEVAALHVVDRGDGLSVNSLAERLNLSKSATSRLVAGLEEKGLLKRKQDPSDSRAILISCSSQGVRFLNEMSVERTRAAESVIRGLSPEISKRLMASIDRFQRKGDL